MQKQCQTFTDSRNNFSLHGNINVIKDISLAFDYELTTESTYSANSAAQIVSSLHQGDPQTTTL